jgi:hypothetical protein
MPVSSELTELTRVIGNAGLTYKKSTKLDGVLVCDKDQVIAIIVIAQSRSDAALERLQKLSRVVDNKFCQPEFSKSKPPIKFVLINERVFHAEPTCMARGDIPYTTTSWALSLLPESLDTSSPMDVEKFGWNFTSTVDQPVMVRLRPQSDVKSIVNTDGHTWARRKVANDASSENRKKLFSLARESDE